MKELVIISGKGGTGKTSITASLSVLAENCVVADCDVDAPDLHLLLSPVIQERHDFYCGHEVSIRREDCTSCGNCQAHCRSEAILRRNDHYIIDPYRCEGCGVCQLVCPVAALDVKERLSGEWMLSKTRKGPMVHACLDASGENSGKLVSKVKEEARRIALEKSIPLLLVDGPPGTGCPVIASISGADMVLILTEPTCSGIHDLHRVTALTHHFGIPTAVCVNKWDLNPEKTEEIEEQARKEGIKVVGRIRYDRIAVNAQMARKTIVEYDNAIAAEIRAMWTRMGF